MHEIMLKPGWETYLVGGPLLLMLLVGFFRLDELLSSSPRRKTPRAQRRPVCGVDRNGNPLLSDPDGRPWRVARSRK